MVLLACDGPTAWLRRAVSAETSTWPTTRAAVRNWGLVRQAVGCARCPGMLVRRAVVSHEYGR